MSRYYQAGVTLAGIGVFTQTNIASTTTQCIRAGNKHRRYHWECGRQGPYISKIARVLYSY